MRLRIAAIAFLLGSVSTGVAWLTLQPTIIRLLMAVRRLAGGTGPDAEWVVRIQGHLPLYLALDLATVTLLTFAVLHFTVGRPLRQAEAAVDQLSAVDLYLPLVRSGGPLLSRLEASLKRMADSLRDEQALTRRQVSELKTANTSLSRAQTELIAADRLATVGKLAAGVAHEVGNPLSGILGYLSLAKSRGVSPEVADMLVRIDAEVQRIDQIVRGLLDIGRPTKGTATAVDVSAIADSCVKLLAAGHEFQNVNIDVTVEPGAVAKAESGPLSQVLINLLMNAAQAMNGRGQIALRAFSRAGQVVIEVQDSGPGIAADAMPHLFEPFFTTKSAGKGSGLGLAVSRHLVVGMDGTLVAANHEAGGALFTISLPAAGA